MARAELMDFDKALEMFEPVLGFEVHVELSTRTKMFSDAPNPALSDNTITEPNTAITPVCLGLPGSLPVVNEQAVQFAISLGLALGCQIAPSSTLTGCSGWQSIVRSALAASGRLRVLRSARTLGGGCARPAGTAVVESDMTSPPAMAGSRRAHGPVPGLVALPGSLRRRAG